MTLRRHAASAGSPSISDGDGAAGFRQMTRGYQAVTAVVAFAAQHHDAPALGQFTQDEAGHGAPGMLHQFERRDPEAVGGDPIGGRISSAVSIFIPSIVEHSCYRETLRRRSK